jgi:undecaprenyl diphosphate synthase
MFPEYFEPLLWSMCFVVQSSRCVNACRNHHGRKRALDYPAGLPCAAGHVVRATIEAAARAGVRTLTRYAFSAAIWARPAAEVDALMRLLCKFLLTETRHCAEQSLRINVRGASVTSCSGRSHTPNCISLAVYGRIPMSSDFHARSTITPTVRSASEP